MRQRLILAASTCALLVTALPAAAQDYNNPQQSNTPPAATGRSVNDAGPNYSGEQNRPEDRNRGQPNGFVSDQDNSYAQGGYRGDYGGYGYRSGYGNYYNYSTGWGGGYVGVSAPGGGANAWCQAHFRSFDPASGTYLGFDGARHSCP
jgi:hypothetical protein